MRDISLNSTKQPEDKIIKKTENRHLEGETIVNCKINRKAQSQECKSNGAVADFLL